MKTVAVNPDIVRAARQGDSRAMDVLGEWMDAELQAFFGTKSGRSEDLIQAAELDILEKLALVPDDPELLRELVQRFAGMEIRESNRDHARELARAAALHRNPQTPPESPSSVLLDEQQRQLVIEHAQGLRPVHRDALLHVLDGGDYKSLAIRHGIPEGTAASRIKNATAKVSLLIWAERRTPPAYRTRRVRE